MCVFKKTSVVFGFVKQEETDWWLFKMGKQTTLLLTKWDITRKSEGKKGILFSVP